MSIEKEVCIARVVNASLPADFPEGTPVLFFPEREVRPGNIDSYMRVGEHGEAGVGFYKNRTRAPRTKREQSEADALFTWYEKRVDAINKESDGDGGYKLIRHSRLNLNKLRREWR